MKKITTLTLLIISLSSNAQTTPELAKGKIYSDSKWAYVNSVFGNDESGYYTFSDMKFKERIEKYDKDFNKLTSVKPEFSEEKYKGREEEATFYYDGKIIAISSSLEKKSDVKSYFVETLNKTTLLTNNDVQKICEYPGSDYILTSVVLSEDKSKVLCLRSLNNDGSGNKQYGISVYDCHTSKVLYTETYSLPYPSSKINYIDGFLGNSGNVYIYYHIYNDGDGKKSNVSSYEGHIMMLYNLGKDKKDILVTMPDKKPGIAKMTEVNGGDVFMAGFYSTDTIGLIKGCFSMKIHRTGEAENVKSMTLDRVNKTTKIDHLIPLEDGSIVLTGEASNHYHQEHAARNWSMGSPANYNSPVNPITGNREGNASTIHDMATTTNSYLNGDIIIVKFDALGAPAWNKTIKKKQFFTVPGEYGYAYLFYASYGLMVSGNKLYIVFNDHIKNADKYDEVMKDDFQRKAESALINVTVNLENGTYGKNILQKSNDNKVLFRPAGSIQVSKNELVMFGSSDEDHQGMIIKF